MCLNGIVHKCVCHGDAVVGQGCMVGGELGVILFSVRFQFAAFPREGFIIDENAFFLSVFTVEEP